MSKPGTSPPLGGEGDSCFCSQQPPAFALLAGELVRTMTVYLPSFWEKGSRTQTLQSLHMELLKWG